MSNRFSHIKSPSKGNHHLPPDLSPNKVSQRETNKLKPKKITISTEAYQTLMGLLATVPESPETPYGVYIDNGTKRSLQLQVRELFHHD